jgi:hypothetical protein
MKIFCSGDGQYLGKNWDPNFDFLIEKVILERVVGVLNLGGNNSENIFGWCSTKAIVNVEGNLYVLDFPEFCRIETNDGILIAEGNEVWHPALEDAEKYDLFVYDERYRFGLPECPERREVTPG